MIVLDERAGWMYDVREHQWNRKQLNVKQSINSQTGEWK